MFEQSRGAAAGARGRGAGLDWTRWQPLPAHPAQQARLAVELDCGPATLGGAHHAVERDEDKITRWWPQTG